MNKKVLIITILLLLFTGCMNVEKRDDKKISKYFTFGEATRSGYADSRGMNNNPGPLTYRRIKKTAKRMDKIRKIVGKPLYVTSWYRSRRVNKKIGGEKDSAHRDGLAVDFQVNGSELEAIKKIKNSGYSFDQIFYYKNRQFIHIGFKKDKDEERRRIFYK